MLSNRVWATFTFFTFSITRNDLWGKLWRGRYCHVVHKVSWFALQSLLISSLLSEQKLQVSSKQESMQVSGSAYLHTFLLATNL